jgi:hypothetical protein
MFNIFQNSIRGGISTISHKYAKANNKYLPDYNPKKPSSYLLRLDVNNLYGFSMNQFLPTGNFEFINPEDFDLENYTPNGEKGYFLEVDLEYPKHLHDEHNDYPLAPEHVGINKL